MIHPRTRRRAYSRLGSSPYCSVSGQRALAAVESWFASFGSFPTRAAAVVGEILVAAAGNYLTFAVAVAAAAASVVVVAAAVGFARVAAVVVAAAAARLDAAWSCSRVGVSLGFLFG